MGNLIVQDIVWHIGQNLKMGQIFCLAGINKQINSYVKHIIWTHDDVDLQFFDEETLLNVFRTYKFTSVDLSNTMITDSFGANMTLITHLAMRNCIGITDGFIKKIPNCKNINLTNCINITGSFLADRPRWSVLVLRDCIFFEVGHLLRIQKCGVLDLRQTTMIHDKLEVEFVEKLSFVLKKCDSIILDIDSNPSIFYPALDPKNDVLKKLHEGLNVKYFPAEPNLVVSPSITHICNYFKSGTTYTQAKMLVRLYIRQRYNFYVKFLLKFDNRTTVDNLQWGYLHLFEFVRMIRIIKEPNILNNILFFRNRYDIAENNFIGTQNKNITHINSYYYDNNMLDDMIKVNYYPHINDPQLKYMSHTELGWIDGTSGHESGLATFEPVTNDFSYDIVDGNWMHRSKNIDTIRVKKIPSSKLNSYLDTYKQIRHDDVEHIRTKLKQDDFANEQIHDGSLSIKQMQKRIEYHFVESHVEIIKNEKIDSAHLRGTCIKPLSKKDFRKILKYTKNQRDALDIGLRKLIQ